MEKSKNGLGLTFATSIHDLTALVHTTRGALTNVATGALEINKFAFSICCGGGEGGPSKCAFSVSKDVGIIWDVRGVVWLSWLLIPPSRAASPPVCWPDGSKAMGSDLRRPAGTKDDVPLLRRKSS